MARILCIDYGKKRCGIAVTDPLKMIAVGLVNVDAPSLIYWLKQYFKQEAVELVLVGYPLSLDGTSTDATPLVDKFLRNFRQVFPDMPVETLDERLSSKMASAAMLEMGMKKKERRNKENLDVLSATMLLQEYLEHLPS